MTKKSIAVILAAGSGERSGFNIPKQLVKLAGKPVIEHTISTFQNSAYIDEIIIVTSNNCIAEIEDIVTNRAFAKVKKIIFGGKERYESSLTAITASEELSKELDIKLIFHDAVRPLVNDRIIRDVVLALDHYNAVDVVVPTTDTMISADPITNTIDSVPDRKKLKNVQTPQGFSWKTIKLAYDIALKDPDFTTTDDCGVVFKYLPDEKIYLVDGETNNIKLTYKDDFPLIEKLLDLNSKNIIWSSISSQMLALLKDKVMVIMTESGSDMGSKIAEIAAAYQAKVIVVAHRDADVTNIDTLNKKFDAIYSEFGKIDYVVNASGVASERPLILMSHADVLRSIQINYTGTVNVAIACYKYLRETHGHLLNFISSSYSYGRAYYSLQGSCSAAVVNLTQALAEEWKTESVRVNCISTEQIDAKMKKLPRGTEVSGTSLSGKHAILLALGVLSHDSTGHVYDVGAQVGNGISVSDLENELSELIQIK